MTAKGTSRTELLALELARQNQPKPVFRGGKRARSGGLPVSILSPSGPYHYRILRLGTCHDVRV